MRIYCPKCKTGYEIDENLIPEEGKKLRCSYCGTIFTARKEDLIATLQHMDAPASILSATEIEVIEKSAEDAVEDVVSTEETVPTAETDAEFKDIFQRLSTETENLFKEEQEMSAPKKAVIKAKKTLKLNKKSNRRFILVVFLAVLSLLMYRFRYEIVRTMPFMEYAYKAVGISSRIPGEGLEFQNIIWDDFEDDYVRKLEVKGFIANTSKYTVQIPQIQVEMLDKDAVLLQALKENPSVKSLKPGAHVAISIVIKKPSPLTKYVFLTFVNEPN